MSGDVVVRGGVGGIEARYDDMVTAARCYGAAAAQAAELATDLAARQLDLRGAVTAALDPIGAVESGWAITEAVGALARLSVECATVDAELRGAAAAYLGADRIDNVVEPVEIALARLPAAVGRSVAVGVHTGSVTRGFNEFLTADPDVVSLPIDERGGVRGLAVAGLTAVMPDGTPKVQSVRIDADPDPPRSLHDLLTGLATRNDGKPGEIDVRILSRANGTRAVIVDIPGTKSWSPLPTHDVTSLTTNLRAIRGDTTTYQRGVEDAMRRAGVRTGDDVMLVGHSEGGMVAVNLARAACHTGAFHVTHIVTAGAPLGAIAGELPSRVRVLALENRGDLVPALDAIRNPDRVNVTTVSVDHEHGDVIADHGIAESYVAGAKDVDASDDPSIREVLDSARPFFDATSGETHVFEISRKLS